MNKNLRKKIKHLRLIMLEYADERLIPGYVPEFLEEDFDFVDDLQIRSKITPIQMKRCNFLYRKYRNDCRI